jgi:hypothetical protein
MPDQTGAVNLVQNMQLADPEPLSMRILKAIAPYVPKRPVGLEVVGIDVMYITYILPNTGQIQSGYVFLMTVRGVLLGDMHNITNAHIIPPSVPTEDMVREYIHISTSRLREARAMQAMKQ